jgi:hypothetical protein
MTERWRPTRPTRTRGKKGVPHTDPEDPPRRRGNKARGHGTWENDRPPVCGVVGREGGQVRLTVAEHADGETLQGVVRRASWPMVSVFTDEWCGYNRLPEMGRLHATVCHAAGELCVVKVIDVKFADSDQGI